MEFRETLELFADDLFAFVMCEHYDMSRSRNIPEHDKGSPFHGTLRMTVRHLLRATEEATRNVFNELIGEQRLMTSVRFQLFAVELIVEVSERGYDPFEFLLFATLLSKLAVMCQSAHCDDCSSAAAAAVVEMGQRFRRKGQLNLPGLLRLNKEICILDVLRQLKVLPL